MFKRLIAFFIYLVSAVQLHAQSVTAKNALFLDVGDSYQVNYSLNYGRIIYQHKNVRVSASAGISIEPVEYSKFWQTLIPLETTLIFGGRAHHWEVGIGLTPGVYYNQYTYSDYPTSNEPIKLITDKSFGTTAGFRIGYRYQKPAGGFFFRTGFTPTFFSSYTPFYLTYMDAGKDGCQVCVYSMPSNKNIGFVPGVSISLGKSF
jgi:hypothetical protein